MPYHAIIIQPGSRQKSIPNKTAEVILYEIALPFLKTGTIVAKWGNSIQSYQALEVRIYETEGKWDKKSGSLTAIIKNKRNKWAKFEQQAQKLISAEQFRVFIVMPIQGEKFGDQDQKRIYKEYDRRFETIEKVIRSFGGVSIRIDKECPLDEVVARIKQEIRKAKFIVADLTDERPSCYFEAGFAEALGKNVIYIASKQSIVKPGTQTKIHFDIHKNIQQFTDNDELEEKLNDSIVKNKKNLLKADE